MKRILIVDNEPHLRLLYEMELRRAGYQTLTAVDADECLGFVETMNPDLILLDIQMPGLDDIEILHKIIALQNRVPIVIQTAYSGYRDNYLAWAADAILLKSSNLKELLATVRRLAPLPAERKQMLKSPTVHTMYKPERISYVEQALRGHDGESGSPGR